MVLKGMSLQQVEDAYRYGTVSDKDLLEYLEQWNATPGRFTTAEWRDGAIRQRVIPD